MSKIREIEKFLLAEGDGEIYLKFLIDASLLEGRYELTSNTGLNILYLLRRDMGHYPYNVIGDRVGKYDTQYGTFILRNNARGGERWETLTFAPNDEIAEAFANIAAEAEHRRNHIGKVWKKRTHFIWLFWDNYFYRTNKKVHAFPRDEEARKEWKRNIFAHLNGEEGLIPAIQQKVLEGIGYSYKQWHTPFLIPTLPEWYNSTARKYLRAVPTETHEEVLLEYLLRKMARSCQEVVENQRKMKEIREKKERTNGDREAVELIV